MTATKPSMSKMRRLYFARLGGRCIVLLFCLLALLFHPQTFDVLQGGFFHRPSFLHPLWGIWMLDMLAQLLPIQKNLPIGSLKLFKQHFRPILKKINPQSLKAYISSTTRAASRVFLLWTALTALLGWLHHKAVLSDTALFLCSVVFYVCDLICVLVWCPFRLMMRNRCCTTCRIFNWDHLMMFSPMLFINSFFARSLLLMSVAVFLLWEAYTLLYPERFWDHSNAALQCVNCTDKLCTQYCRKLR